MLCQKRATFEKAIFCDKNTEIQFSKKILTPKTPDFRRFRPQINYFLGLTPVSKNANRISRPVNMWQSQKKTFEHAIHVHRVPPGPKMRLSFQKSSENWKVGHDFIVFQMQVSLSKREFSGVCVGVMHSLGKRERCYQQRA